MTSGAARTLGLDHRLGYVLPKYDADVVLWDRAPLSLGATPVQVVIDGVPQLDRSLAEAAVAHQVSHMPGPPAADLAAELERVNESGPDIIALQASATPLPIDRASDVTFTNVSVVFARTSGGKIERTALRGGEVQVVDGKIACAGKACASSLSKSRKIDLRGGTIIPGLTTVSGDLGLADITSEPDTSDGFASARSSFAALVGDDARPLARAADVIQWGGNDALRTHAAGFTSVVSAPRSQGFVSGLSTRWAPGALDAWEHSAINASVVALHAEISHLQTSQARSALSEAEQIGLLRALLRSGSDRIHAHASGSDNADVWQRVVRGDLPLVVAASRAERLSALVKLAHEHPHMRLVLAGAHEAAHGGLPEALARANVGVLLRPQTWNVEYDARRDLPGPPLSRDTTLSVLRKAGVKVGFQLEEAWQATSLLWDAAWAAEQAGLKQAEAIELVSTK
jgi:imidazolonepropionase-like amidohydrolase